MALGVSAEDQAAWDARVPILRQVRARLRFVSVEPMIGPITNPHGLSALEELVERSAATGAYIGPEDRVYAAGIGWVIIGGESGPNARPMHPDWPRSLIAACDARGVPVHFKQWGEWGPDGAGEMRRVGKVAAGRTIDGATHDWRPTWPLGVRHG